MKLIGIEQLSQELHQEIKRGHDLTLLIDKVSHIVAEFLSNTQWFRQFVEGSLFRDSPLFKTDSIWSNEITLWRSPDKELYIFAYIWEPFQVSPIHDHGAWGVVAASIQPLVERKYQRLDDGAKRGYVELKDVLCKTIRPGDATYVLPLDRGIHCLENATGKYMISLSVFGRAVRTGYLQFFYPERRAIERVYPPRTHRQVLLMRALETLDEPWVDEVLGDILKRDLPDFIKKESRFSLKKRS